MPPIEIENKCDKNEFGISCVRRFDVSKYIADVKGKFEQPEKQTIVEKLAGVNPTLFKYSIGFKDNLSITGWKNQHTFPIPKDTRDCPFPENFLTKGDSGAFTNENFGFYEFSEKLQELATSLNDCKTITFPSIPGVDCIERSEKYDIFIKLNPLSHLTLLFLALVLTSFTLGFFKVLYQFAKKGFGE